MENTKRFVVFFFLEFLTVKSLFVMSRIFHLKQSYIMNSIVPIYFWLLVQDLTLNHSLHNNYACKSACLCACSVYMVKRSNQRVGSTKHQPYISLIYFFILHICFHLYINYPVPRLDSNNDIQYTT
jgi:hypothetical protein